MTNDICPRKGIIPRVMHFATLKGLVGGFFFLEKQMVFAVNWRHCFNYDFDFAKTMSFVIWCVAALSSNLPPTRTNVNRIIPMCIEP